MKMHLNLAVLALAATVSSAALADAQVPEWYGNWNFSLDGRPGALTITDTKADCASSAWCAMAVNYRGANGVLVRGTIVTIDSKWQHMRFRLAFPGNNQTFDAYLFSWDKRKMSGTTVWNGRTFGFLATK
ncbi:DUF6006 family protein [Novosphingobium sp.]|uniref:DUF6006 family protein n=1 Tax=Novosphingobium sp. TaxID=1874826 RepID=UPI00286A8A0F|nr:DUF6006 family protein [Novosphingobium sp.]